MRRNLLYKGANTGLAGNLRKDMTKEERHLWYDFLRGLPVKFYRQRQIAGYIVDFYCASAKLVIELDGSQHFDEAAEMYDKARTAALEEYGLKIIRFTNRDVWERFKEIKEAVYQEVEERKLLCR